DQQVQRGRVDVTLLGQDRLQRADAQLRLRQVGMISVVVMMVEVVIVVMSGHGGEDTQNRGYVEAQTQVPFRQGDRDGDGGKTGWIGRSRGTFPLSRQRGAGGEQRLCR